MSDTLRDRIAAALRGHGGAYSRDGLEFCSCGAETDGLLEFEAHLADAVIRELNLDISHTYKTSQGREVCIEGFWTEEATDGTA